MWSQLCQRDGFGAGEAQRVIPIVNEGVKLGVRRRQEPWSKQEGLIRVSAVALEIGKRVWGKKCLWCRMGRTG